LSFASFVLGWNIVGGVLAQISSIADGVDGELARLKKMASPFGGFMDAVLDRYADALIILGMTIWAAGHEAYRGIWIVGFLAMVGTLCISYTRAKAPDAHRNPFDRGIASAASRDVRLFLIMLGGILGQVYNLHLSEPAFEKGLANSRKRRARHWEYCQHLTSELVDRPGLASNDGDTKEVYHETFDLSPMEPLALVVQQATMVE
jgi:phosphatidylglycerophosphate synthase